VHAYDERASLRRDAVVLASWPVATFRRKKPFSDDRATNLGARTDRQVAADKV